MKILSFAMVFSLALVLFSCGEKVDDLKQAAEVIQRAPEIANNIEKSQKESELVKAERKKRGDTTAMPYEKLQGFLPASINGYKAEEPSGETIDMQGMSYSNVSRRYVKTNADGTEDRIEIDILDFNAVETMFSAQAFWVVGIRKEDQNSKEMTFDPGLKNSYAYEKFMKQSKDVELSYAVAFRFIVNMKANNQTSTDNLKAIAKTMKLDELAKY
jgi:hypothetical protein